MILLYGNPKISINTNLNTDLEAYSHQSSLFLDISSADYNTVQYIVKEIDKHERQTRRFSASLIHSVRRVPDHDKDDTVL